MTESPPGLLAQFRYIAKTEPRFWLIFTLSGIAAATVTVLLMAVL